MHWKYVTWTDWGPEGEEREWKRRSIWRNAGQEISKSNERHQTIYLFRPANMKQNEYRENHS